MAQFGRPDSDVSATNFAGFTATTPGSLCTNIDESSANDSDYAYTIATSASYECGLSDVSDPGVHTGHTVRWRVSLSSPLGGGDDPIGYTVSLYQGATLIASYSGSVGIATVAGVSYTLSSGEASAITDYTDLRLRFAVASATSPSVRFTWAELEVPDEPASDIVDIDGADVVLEPADVGEIPGEIAIDIDGADVVLEPADVESVAGIIVDIDGANVVLELADVDVVVGIVVDISGADLVLEPADTTGSPGASVIDIPGTDVVLDVVAVDPSHSIVDIDGADVALQVFEIDSPGEPTDPDPDPPTGPVIPDDESQRFLVLPRSVLVSMPAENRLACESTVTPNDEYASGASFAFDLAYFDHTRPDGFRDGWGPENIRLGFNSAQGGNWPSNGEFPGPPLYPFWWSYTKDEGPTDGHHSWQYNPHVTSVASSFLVMASDYISRVSHSPVDASRILENYEAANQIAMFAGRDYYGWRVAGGDERYDGIVAYPIDAHDDTLIFTYRDGEASVRITPVPHMGSDGASQLHASEFNCEREIVRYNAPDPCTRSHGGRTRTNWPWEERPLYADGTLGEVCRRGKDCTETVTSCPDSTLCVQVGAAYDPSLDRLTNLRPGVYVLILDDSGATVATGTTDSSGYACFGLPGGNYYIKLRCVGPPSQDFVYWCERPYSLPPCGKSLTVKIGFCRSQKCVKAVDFDTGAGVDGLWVGQETDQSGIACDTTPETVYTGRDGAGRACLWGPHVQGSSILSLQPRDLAARPDPLWEPGACFPPGVHLGRWLLPQYPFVDGAICGADPCCGSREYGVAFYDRAKWTKLINWCGAYPGCQATSRHPSMVPRRLFASITAPDPVWKNLNGVSIPLDCIGVKRFVGLDDTCVQVWDSGCLPGAGQYWCSQYAWRAVPRFWQLVPGSTTDVDYAASRVRIFVQSNITRPGLLLRYRAGIIVENFAHADDCAAVDPFIIPEDPGVISIDTNRFGNGGNPECGPCLRATEGAYDGQTTYCSGAQAPLVPPSCMTSLFAVPYYGFMSCCLGRNGMTGCSVFTGPDCKGESLTASGCPTKSNALAGPINYSGTFTTCAAEVACRWSATYDVFE